LRLHFELYLTDDNQIHLVLQGEACGAIVFRDTGAFAAFMEEVHALFHDYKQFIEAYQELLMMETPIPEPFLDAFDD